MTIYKYPLLITEKQEMEIPKGAKYLTLKLQNGIPCLWAKVSEKDIKVKTTFLMIGTGQEIPNGAEYIGTIHLTESNLVFHVFQE